MSPTANAAADYIAKRLDALADEVERGWIGRFTEGEGFCFERTVRGVKDVAIIDDALLGSADARKLDEYAAKLQEAYPRPGLLRRKDTETAIHGPVGLFEAVTDAGRKGVTLQRYKGLGEMNPEPALGDHARHQRALAAAGEGQGGRRGRRHLHQADGRRGRAAPRIHPGQFAQRQCGRVRHEASRAPYPIHGRRGTSAGRDHRACRQQERRAADHCGSASDRTSGDAAERSADSRYRNAGRTDPLGRRIGRLASRNTLDIHAKEIRAADLDPDLCARIRLRAAWQKTVACMRQMVLRQQGVCIIKRQSQLNTASWFYQPLTSTNHQIGSGLKQADPPSARTGHWDKIDGGVARQAVLAK